MMGCAVPNIQDNIDSMKRLFPKAHAFMLFESSWCPDCVRTKTCLEGLKVAFDYDDAGDPKENAAKASGSNRIPCVALPDGSFMNEPSDEALTAKLKELGVL